MTARRAKGLSLLAVLALLGLALPLAPGAIGAAVGDESLQGGQYYYRKYDLLAGEKLTWDWHTVPAGGNLTFELTVDGTDVMRAEGDSGSGEYTAGKDCHAIIKWTNWYSGEVTFHYQVEREISPNRYVPAILAVVAVVVAITIAFVVVRQRLARKKA